MGIMRNAIPSQLKAIHSFFITMCWGKMWERATSQPTTPKLRLSCLVVADINAHAILLHAPTVSEILAAPPQWQG